MANWFQKFFGIGEDVRELEARLATVENRMPTPKTLEKRDVSPTQEMTSDQLLKALGVNLGDFPVTELTALGIASLYRCVDLLSSAVALPPWEQFIEIDDDGTRVKDRKHNNWNILTKRPSRHTNPFYFRKMLITHALLHGNGIAEIKRDNYNRVSGFEILKPGWYWLILTPDFNFFVQKYDGTILQQEDFIHVKTLGVDERVGKSVPGLGTLTLKTEMKANAFMDKYLSGGTFLNGYLTSVNNVSKPDREAMASSWDEKYFAQNIDANFSTPVLTNGLKFEQLTKSNTDSQLVQFLESHPTKIYQFFGVPPHLAQDTSKSTSFGTGIEDLTTQFALFTVEPFTTQLCQEFDYKCLTPAEQETRHTAIDLDKLKPVTYINKMEGAAKMVNNGVMKPNDVRRTLHLNPDPNGDALMANGNFITLENVKLNEPKQQVPKNDTTEGNTK